MEDSRPRLSPAQAGKLALLVFSGLEKGLLRLPVSPPRTSGGEGWGKEGISLAAYVFNSIFIKIVYHNPQIIS
jgi:hypothetical protein